MTHKILIALVLLFAPLAAQNVEETLSAQTADGQPIDGHIDWSTKILVVYGEAVAPDHINNPVHKRLMGFRGAKAVAYRNLLEMVGQVQVDAETRVQNFMVENDSISVRVQGIVRGARVQTGSQTESAEGLYRLALEIPLLGAFSHAVLPTDLPPPDLAISYALPMPVPAQTDTLAVIAEVDVDSLSLLPDAPPAIYVPPKPYTGLIVDARGLDLQPSMSPRIIAKDGRTIYSASSSDPDYVAEYGLVGYDKDLRRARNSDRLGGETANPFVVKAASVSGLYSGDIVLDNFDATLVLMADVDGEFLRECRVTFVLGPEPIVIDDAFIDSLYIDSPQLDPLSEGEILELPEQTRPSNSTE
jgi:hypothetical protein